MKHVATASRRRKLFDLLLASTTAQAAMMTLEPGQSSSDDPENEHPRAEQWLLVLSGTGRAKNAAKRGVPLRPGSLLLIERDEPHQITNTGKVNLVTFNLYVPPAYDRHGDVRRGVKRR